VTRSEKTVTEQGSPRPYSPESPSSRGTKPASARPGLRDQGTPRRGIHPGDSDLVGGGGRGEVPWSGASCFLCGDDSPGVRKWGQGPLHRQDVNRYLKWAYSEATTVVAHHRRKHPERHVSQLYEKVMRRKGHQKAIGAVDRHLAEATYWVLTRGEPNMDPQVSKKVREVGAQARN